MIDTGLVIDEPWITKILTSEKTWEIRSKPNWKSGRIALCLKGGPIVATAVIGPSIRLLSDEFEQHFSKHQVPTDVLREFYGDRPVHAWPLTDVRKLEPPIRYQHPGGGSWVRLSTSNVPDFDQLQSEAG